MLHIDNNPVAETLRGARDRSERLGLWIDQLRSGDATFAEASALYPDDMGELQAAVYLLAGCEVVWAATKADVLAKRSIGPVIDELQGPRRAWASSEDEVMRWAAHFWDINRWPVTFPYAFEEFYFRRWITASHLYKKIPPALTAANRGQR